MRQQAMEKLLIQMEDAITYNDMTQLKQLAAKSRILRDRSDKSASIVRELINS